MGKNYILAFDQGTTSSRTIVWDAEGNICGRATQEFKQIYPKPGWVEHDPEAIWETQLATAQQAMSDANAAPGDIAAIGITNQRETTVIWDRKTGKPIHNAIVWQCRRTADYCDQFKAEGFQEEVRKRSGLIIDAYFSGSKVKWILDHVDGARERASKGELCFGTIDSWLLYKLLGRHLTDPSNACRTMLYNIHERGWDDTLTTKLDVPHEILPEVKPTSGVFGETTVLGGAIPVAAACGDQQSALFGQCAFNRGESKNTYGTGSFLLVNTGQEPVASDHGMLTSVAWDLGDQFVYNLEGSIFITGAVVQWLRDELKLISSAPESEEVARQVEDNGGVYLVPAFVGLGAPHWEQHARGTIVGLTRGSNRAHIVRAALESISFQSADVLRAMESDTGEKVDRLKVDGGAAMNNLLMQHQADIIGIPVVRGKITETTALGAAFLAGRAVNFWPDEEALRAIWSEDRVFDPAWSRDQAEGELNSWHKAVKAAISAGN